MEKAKNTDLENNAPAKKAFYFANGKMYFNKKTERRFYFFLTMIILVWALLAKTGII